MIHCRDCEHARPVIDPHTKEVIDVFYCDLLLETLSMMGQAVKVYFDTIKVLGSFGCILGKEKNK